MVNNREMPDIPDINVQSLVTGTFLDGGFGFEMAHGVTMTRGGASETRTVTEVGERPTRPMTTEEVRAKATDLMRRPLGEERAVTICDCLLAVEQPTDARDLTVLPR